MVDTRDWTSQEEDNINSYQQQQAAPLKYNPEALLQGQQLLKHPQTNPVERLLIHVILAYHNWRTHNTHEVLKEVYTRGAMAHLKQERGAKSLGEDRFSSSGHAWCWKPCWATGKAARRMLTYVVVDDCIRAKLEEEYLPIPMRSDSHLWAVADSESSIALEGLEDDISGS